jgi:exonuclease SbcD
MKLLHTGDLHLGKNLHETSLLEDQRAMLDGLEAELSRDDYAALLIAGDVYDRTIPPAEAVELFSGFLVRVRKNHPDLRIGVIPGNHDSARRLSYADRILGEQGIHIVCNPEDSFNPIIIDKSGERLALFLLPFLAPGTLAPGTRGTAANGATAASAPNAGSSRAVAAEPEFDFGTADAAGPKLLATQADLAAEAARRFGIALDRGDMAELPAVLVAHCLTLAGLHSESERVFLGTAEEISPALFSRFTYVALGHLHRSQKITPRMYYSGSPLAYAFDEAGTRKNFLKVEIDCAAQNGNASARDFPVTVTPIPVVPLHPVTRLSGSFEDFYNGHAHDSHAAEYLEITLTDDSLVANPVNLLRPKFPNLLSLRQGLLADEREGAVSASDGHKGENGKVSAPDAAKRDPVADFEAFETMLHGNVDPARKELFAALLAECADTDNRADANGSVNR